MQDRMEARTPGPFPARWSVDRSMTKSMKRLAPGYILLALAAVSCRPDDECDSVGDWWCDGDTLSHCANEPADTLEGGGFVNRVDKDDCRKHEASCIEETDAKGPFAYCGYPKTPCSRDAVDVCIGDAIIASCRSSAHPQYTGECSEDPGCQLDTCNPSRKRYCAVSLGASICVAEPGSCSPDGAMKCSKRYEGVWLECDQGVWMNDIRCAPGLQCVDDKDGGVACR